MCLIKLVLLESLISDKILIFSLFSIIADRSLSRKSTQKAENTEDINEKSDDGIGAVLQVCGSFALLLIFLLSFSPSLSRGAEVKGVNG